MSQRAAFVKLTRLVALVLAVFVGCTPPLVAPGPTTLAPTTSTSSAATTSAATAKPTPATATEAADLKQRGISWSNEEIRLHYNHIVSTIAAANEKWKQEGLSAETRARKAFEIRHDARLTCRAMMSSAAEVEDLRERDREKYGHPDGPTFDQLVEKARAKGTTGDAVYEGIIASAGRTDEKVNAENGVPKAPRAP